MKRPRAVSQSECRSRGGEQCRSQPVVDGVVREGSQCTEHFQVILLCDQLVEGGERTHCDKVKVRLCQHVQAIAGPGRVDKRELDLGRAATGLFE
eukprot:1368542-Rhodomonas_salina.2